MNIGKVIRQLRHEKHWAIEDLAAYLDTVRGGDRASISKIETGQRWPRPDVLRGLASAFGLEVHQLFALAEGAELLPSEITPEEREWLQCLRGLPENMRGHVVAVIRELSAHGSIPAARHAKSSPPPYYSP
jgi:transcriptional regulator with XRE-family HTH domain